MMCLVFAIEAVFHYIFIRKYSYFLIIKEDLVFKVCWRAALGVTLMNSFVKFHRPQRMPMTYHTCTGTNRTAEGPADGPTDTYFNLTICMYILAYAIFTALIFYEKLRPRVTQQDPNGLSRALGPTLNNAGIVIKITYGVLANITYIWYDESVPEDLNSFPGYIFVYLYHFIMLPAFILTYLFCRASVDTHFRNHFKILLRRPMISPQL